LVLIKFNVRLEMAYGDNEKSQKVMLEVAKNKQILGRIVKLCDITWEEGLKRGNHLPSKWFYNGMLRDLGRKLEGKTGRRLVAGSLMYENAKQGGLLEQIKDLISEGRKLGIQKGYYDGTSKWTSEGLLQSLGTEIEHIEGGRKLPQMREDEYYTKF
jgi:hypothetical protein